MCFLLPSWSRGCGGGEGEDCLVVLEVVALQVLVSLLCSCWTQGWESEKVFLPPPCLPDVIQSQDVIGASDMTTVDIATKALRIVVGERKVTFRLTSLSLSQGKMCDIKGTQEEAGLEELFT